MRIKIIYILLLLLLYQTFLMILYIFLIHRT